MIKPKENSVFRFIKHKKELSSAWNEFISREWVDVLNLIICLCLGMYECM